MQQNATFLNQYFNFLCLQHISDQRVHWTSSGSCTIRIWTRCLNWDSIGLGKILETVGQNLASEKKIKKGLVSWSLSNKVRVKVKWSRYRPGVAQRVGRGIALLFHDRGTRRRWVISSTPRPQFNPGKNPVPILQEAWRAPGPVWTDGKSRPHRDSMPDCPAPVDGTTYVRPC